MSIVPHYKLSSPFARFAGWGAVMGGSTDDLRFIVLNSSGTEFLCPVYIRNVSGTYYHVSKEVLDESGDTVIPA